MTEQPDLEGPALNIDLCADDLIAWYSERELNFLPAHFVKTTAPVTFESLSWVRDRLAGRYALGASDNNADNFMQWNRNTKVRMTLIDEEDKTILGFEDHKEATLYELTWS